MSSVKWHQENLNAPSMMSSSSPIAVKTWLEVYEEDVQALPLEIAAIPFNEIMAASELTPLTDKFKVEAREFSWV